MGQETAGFYMKGLNAGATIIEIRSSGLLLYTALLWGR